MNKFYNQPVFMVWIESITLLVVGFFPAILIIQAGDFQPLFYLLLLIYLPIIQFSATPFFKLIGVYRYYSPMLMGYMPNNIKIDLHSGTSFDYLFVMRCYKAGPACRNALLIYYLEGLLKLIEQIEKKKIAGTVNIVGTSYFFNERSISKLGFTMLSPSPFYRINLLVNFIDLIWMHSVSKGRLSMPQIWKAKKTNILGHDLVKNKTRISDLYKALKSVREDQHQRAEFTR